MKKAGIAMIGIALVAGVIYSVRAPLSTAVLGRALERNMSTKLLDTLPDGLNGVDEVFERFTLGADGTGFSMPAGSTEIAAMD